MKCHAWTVLKTNMQAYGGYTPVLLSEVLALFVLCVILHSGCAQKGVLPVKKTIHIDATVGVDGFKEDEKFRDMFELTEENFEEWVLKAEDPWIVVFTDGMLRRDWKMLAVSLRGIVWFGMLHRIQQDDFLQEIAFDPLKNPLARVYPFGGTKQKTKWTDVHTIDQAREIAVGSLPDITTEIDEQTVNDFIFDSYMANPTTFPGVFIVEKEVSPLFKSIAFHYRRYFNFGVIREPNSVYLAKLKYNIGTPGCFILISEDYGTIEDEGNEVDYTFQSIGYAVERQGELNYPNLVKFLYSINVRYRHTLPGDSMADDEDVLRMDEVMEVEGQRFNVRYMDDLENDLKFAKLKDKESWKNEL